MAVFFLKIIASSKFQTCPGADPRSTRRPATPRVTARGGPARTARRGRKESHQMSVLIDAEIVNAVVLAAVLEADLGSHRTIGRFRILRPLILAVAIVPFFLEKVTTHGGGLAVELAGVAAGLVGGLLAVVLMRVYRSGKTGQPVSSAKWGYALLWIVVIGARAAFSYGAHHWFSQQLGSWL